MSSAERARIFLLVSGLLLPSAASAETDFQSVVVQPGDTLWGIAQKYLEDPHRWDEILKHNKQLGADSTSALPGMTLRVPVGLIKAALRAAKLTYIEGDVLYRAKEKDEWKKASQDMPLYPGDMLKTESWSRARIKFPRGSVLNMYSGSQVAIKPAGPDGEDLKLMKGMLRALHLHLKAGAADIRPRHEDTIFEAKVKDGVSVEVEVFNGLADVSGVRLEGGQQVDVVDGIGPGKPREMSDASTSPDKMRAVRRYKEQQAQNAKTTDLDFTLDVDAIRAGSAVSGLRVQLSRTPDFSGVVMDKMFEPDQRINLRAAGAVSGAYWWRAAPVDLLGVTGRFSEPKRAVIP